MAGRLFDRDGLDSAAAREKAVRPPEPPATVTAFLGRLTLLHGVPFPYLVPDARLLPAESLKIFLIDPRWLDALVGGALGVGRGGTTRLLLDKAQAGNFIADILAAARSARPPGRGDATGTPETTPSFAFSGFLLRSRVLDAWPGLEVRAWRSGGRGAEDALALLRLDRLAPDILLGIVDGRMREVEITQPPEGLHFIAKAPPSRHDSAERVIDVASWTDGLDGSAALAKARMSEPLRFVFRIGG